MRFTQRYKAWRSDRGIWYALLTLPWLALLVCLMARTPALTCFLGGVALMCTSVSLFFLFRSSMAQQSSARSTVSPSPMHQASVLALQDKAHLQDFPSLPHTLAQLRGMDPKDFELLSAAILVACEEQRFVKHTGKKGDRGVDGLLLNSIGNRVILQCKRNGASNRVGPDKIRELGGTLRTHHAVYGYLITSSTFTKAAYQEKASHGFIRTFDGFQLMDLLQRHPRSIAQALTIIHQQVEAASLG